MVKTISNIIHNIKKEKMLSITNIAVMSVTFTLLGLFLLIVTWSQTALRYLEKQVQVSVFFKDDFTQENILKFKETLEKDPRVLSVKYISKDEAFKIFTEINKDEPLLLESVSPSILPASLEIKAVYLRDLKTLADEYSKTDGVEEVRFFKDVAERFRSWTQAVYITGFLLVVVFLAISYSVVNATLRATINSKGTELEIMKLVGADDSYVKNPLVAQGVFYGVSSSLIASLIISPVVLVVGYKLTFENGFTYGLLPNFLINPALFLCSLVLLMLISGFLIGYLGSTAAIKKYLRY